jgi:small subunit ribosomal protein S5e
LVGEHNDGRPEFALEPKLFGKWSYEGVETTDISLANYLQVKTVKQQVYVPYTAGRYQQRKFKKVTCPIIERLICMLMTSGGRNNGKKQNAVRIVKHTLELIHLITGKNPIQIIVSAIQEGGAREDSTRIGSGGTVRRQAVDVSPLRRINQAIYLICKGSREAAFRNLKSIQETLADELINAAKVSQTWRVLMLCLGYLRHLVHRQKEGRDRKSFQGQQMKRASTGMLFSRFCL